MSREVVLEEPCKLVRVSARTFCARFKTITFDLWSFIRHRPLSHRNTQIVSALTGENGHIPVRRIFAFEHADVHIVVCRDGRKLGERHEP